MALYPQTDSRIADANRSWQGACNVDITNWDKANEFIISTWALSDVKNDDANFKLQWRRAGGTFADVAADTEICWGTDTVLTDGGGLLSGNSAGCLAPWDSGTENEGDNSAYASNIDINDYWEGQWALGFGSGALDGQEYEIQLVCIEYPGSAICQTSITTLSPTVRTVEARGRIGIILTKNISALGRIQTIPISTGVYYFNDLNPSDPDEAWDDDPNAFDGSIATSATTTAGVGSTESKFLYGQGTNVGGGGTILQVQARLYASGVSGNVDAAIYTDGLGELLGTPTASASGPGQWGDWLTLSIPSGGWSWDKLQDLETKIYKTISPAAGGVHRVEIEITFKGRNITAKSIIQKSLIQTITAKGNITIGFEKTTRTVEAKSRIQTSPTQTINTKGYIEKWYDSNWKYRIKIKINASEVDADLTDFPVYVRLSDLDEDFFTNVKENGADIRITKGDGKTELPREVVFCNKSTKTGELHFKYAGILSSTIDTYVYIYYGNSAASDYARNHAYGLENVWNDDYIAVYHLQEDANTDVDGYKDSTSNLNHGQGVSMSEAARSGKLAGKAASFDGQDDRINLPNLITNNTWSITAYFYIDAFNGSNNGTPIFYQGGGDLDLGSANFGGLDTGVIKELWARSGGATIADSNDDVIDSGNWYHCAGTFNGATASFYVNGGVEGTDTVDGTAYADNAALGAWYDYTSANRHTDGGIDEVRITDNVLPGTWISTEHSNLSAPATFYTTYSQEPFDTSVQNIQAKGNITTGFIQKTRTVEAKGSIKKSFIQSIEAKGNITFTKTRILTALGRIRITPIQSLTAKADVKREFTQTTTSLGRIQKQFSQSIQTKGRIGISSIKTVEVKGRISTTTTKTIQSRGRIGFAGIRNIDAKANLEKTVNQTIGAKGNILSGATRTQTIDTKADVIIWGEWSAIWWFDIPTTIQQTIQALAKITATTTQSIQTKANITVTCIQTIQALGRITQIFIQTIEALSRIEKEFIQTIETLGRITATYEQTIETKAVILKIFTQTIQALARITIISIQPIEAKTNIKATQQQEIQAKSRIKAPFGQTIDAKANIKITQIKAVTARASIKKIFQKTIGAKGCIRITNAQIVEAKANIVSIQIQTIQAKARIGALLGQIIEARGRITKTFTQTAFALGRITVAIQQTINAKANIAVTIQRQATIKAKGRIALISQQTVDTKGSIKIVNQQNISAKGRIQTIGEQTITAKARIGIISIQTTEAKANIVATSEQTINAKASIKVGIEQQIIAKTRISVERIKTISAKANITSVRERTIKAKANIVYLGMLKRISAKASIRVGFEQTIQTKANIIKLFASTISAKAAIATYRVVEIIDKVRTQELVDEITYVKQITKDVGYTKVEVSDIISSRLRARDIPRTRPRVVEITDLGRVQRIKWIIAKARIKN